MNIELYITEIYILIRVRQQHHVSHFTSYHYTVIRINIWKLRSAES